MAVIMASYAKKLGYDLPAAHRSPMVFNVRKVRGRVLIADAVDAEMPGFKNNRTQVRVIAGFCQPFHLALAIYIDRIEISGLFVLCRSIRQTDSDGVAVKIGNRRFFPAGEIHQRQVIDRPCADGSFGFFG